MRGGRILWGQIAVVFAIALVMVWAATQWTAFRLGFQPQLGAPWFELAGLPIYYPPAFFWWWFSFDAYAPAIFVEGGIIAVSGGFLAIAAAILMSIIRAREARNVATYGSARWAEDREIRASNSIRSTSPTQRVAKVRCQNAFAGRFRDMTLSSQTPGRD